MMIAMISSISIPSGSSAPVQNTRYTERLGAPSATAQTRSPTIAAPQGGSLSPPSASSPRGSLLNLTV